MRTIRLISRWAVLCLTLLALACVTAGPSSAQLGTSRAGESQTPITLRADTLTIKEADGERTYQYAYCILVPMKVGTPRTQAEALLRQFTEAGKGPKAAGAFWRVGEAQTDPPIVYALTTFNQGNAINDAYRTAIGRADVPWQLGRQMRIVTKAATFVPQMATLTLEGSDESPTTLEGPDAAYRLGGRKVEVVLGKGVLRITGGSVEQVKPAPVQPPAAGGAKAPAATPAVSESRRSLGSPVALREVILTVQPTEFAVKHITPLRAKVLLEGPDGPLSGGRGTVNACAGDGTIAVTPSQPVLDEVREFLEKVDVPPPDPLPPDQVLERYLEAWIIPCDDTDPSSAPDYKAMYALTTKAGQAQISYEEFRELIGPALQTDTRTTYNQFGQRSTEYTTEGPTSILHVYEPEVRRDAAYVWYTLRVERSARTVGHDEDGRPLGSLFGMPGAEPNPYVAPPEFVPNQHVVPPAGNGGDPADPAPAGAEAKAAEGLPARGNYGGGGPMGGTSGMPSGPGGGFGFGGYGGYGGGGSRGGWRPAREGNIERNQAVLVKEDGQWRLPMRFDTQARRWYLPLSTDPTYFTPNGEPAGLRDLGTHLKFGGPAGPGEGGLHFGIGPQWGY